MNEPNGGGGPGAGLLDPPASKADTHPSSAQPQAPGKTKIQPAAGKATAAFFSKETGRKVIAGAKWIGLGSLVLGTCSFIYRKAKGMSWGAAFASGFSFGPLDPQ